MKIILLSIITIATVTFSSRAQNVSIPDANFKANLIGDNLINTNGDTEIQLSEASAFTGIIWCANLSISDLTGIEAFTAITQLHCHNNSITTLNVTQNTELTALGCYNNQLTSLDVTQNTFLTQLTCYENLITSLDVTQNTALAFLYCHTNSLSSLNVSLNTSLEYLQCYTNQLTSLDVTLNTALLELFCGENQLTAIDITQNALLTKLNCFTNQITDLDVSINAALNVVSCGENQLTSLNVANGNNSNFILLNATDNANLSCVEVDDISWSTTNWPSPSNVDAGVSFSTGCSCVITVPDVNFKTYLLGNSSINTNNDTEIQCDEAINFTGTLDCSSLNVADLTGVEAFTSLTRLRCGGNVLTALNVSQNTVLTYISCTSNSIAVLDVTQNTVLDTLYCYTNSLAVLDVSQNLLLSEFLCQDNQLTNLDLSQNVNLKELWCKNNLLTSLNLANGNNTNIGKLYIQNNPDLNCIQVDDETYSTTNWIGSSFVFDVASSFSVNCNVGLNEEVSSIDLLMYPNPSLGIVNIEFGSFKNGSVKVFSPNGQLVYMNENISSSKYKFELNEIAGIYFVEMSSNNTKKRFKLIMR
jgi:hypothetical protein